MGKNHASQYANFGSLHASQYANFGSLPAVELVHNKEALVFDGNDDLLFSDLQ